MNMRTIPAIQAIVQLLASDDIDTSTTMIASEDDRTEPDEILCGDVYGTDDGPQIWTLIDGDECGSWRQETTTIEQLPARLEVMQAIAEKISAIPGVECKIRHYTSDKVFGDGTEENVEIDVDFRSDALCEIDPDGQILRAFSPIETQPAS